MFDVGPAGVSKGTQYGTAISCTAWPSAPSTAGRSSSVGIDAGRLAIALLKTAEIRRANDWGLLVP
jgi:hypothetical protein